MAVSFGMAYHSKEFLFWANARYKYQGTLHKRCLNILRHTLYPSVDQNKSWEVVYESMDTIAKREREKMLSN